MKQVKVVAAEAGSIARKVQAVADVTQSGGTIV